MAGTIAALPSAINKDTLATFEKQSRGEIQAESGGNTKGLQAMSDMKKRLEAFRESKKKKSKADRPKRRPTQTNSCFLFPSRASFYNL